MRYLERVSLAERTTFGVGGLSQAFVIAEEEGDREALAELWRSSSLALILGGGSNTLFVGDYPGTIFHSGLQRRRILERWGDNCRVSLQSGLHWDESVSWLVDQGCFGVENLSGIPGSVGGAVAQNIGAYGVELAPWVESVGVWDLRHGRALRFSAEESRFGYRDSLFQQGDYFVTDVHLLLKQVFVPRLDYPDLQRYQGEHGAITSAEQARRAILAIRHNKLPPPEVTGNAGSFFKNPVVGYDKWAKLQRRYPDMPGYELKEGVKIPAAWLIQSLGWKGRSLGASAVSQQHALVLVNRGGASGKEVWSLAQRIRDDVKRHYSLDLLPEVRIIGAD